MAKVIADNGCKVYNCISSYLEFSNDENGNVVAVFRDPNEVNKYSLGDLFLVIDKGGLPMKLDTNTGILYEQF